MTSVLCFIFHPETVHCSTKDAYTSEIRSLHYNLGIHYLQLRPFPPISSFLKYLQYSFYILYFLQYFSYILQFLQYLHYPLNFSIISSILKILLSSPFYSVSLLYPPILIFPVSLLHPPVPSVFLLFLLYPPVSLLSLLYSPVSSSIFIYNLQ